MIGWCTLTKNFKFSSRFSVFVVFRGGQIEQLFHLHVALPRQKTAFCGYSLFIRSCGHCEETHYY